MEGSASVLLSLLTKDLTNNRKYGIMVLTKHIKGILWH